MLLLIVNWSRQLKCRWSNVSKHYSNTQILMAKTITEVFSSTNPAKAKSRLEEHVVDVLVLVSKELWDTLTNYSKKQIISNI